MEEVVLNKLSELLGKMVGAKAKDAPVEPVPEPTPPPPPRKISVGEIDGAELEALITGLVEKGIQENNQNQSLEEIPDADSYIDAKIDDFLHDYDFPAPLVVDADTVNGLEDKVRDALNDLEDELTEKIKTVVQDVDRDGIDTSAVNGLEEMINNRVDEALDEADLLPRHEFNDAFDRKVRESPNNKETALNRFFDDGMNAYCVTDTLWSNNLDKRILRVLQSDEGRTFIEGVMEKVLVAVIEKLEGKKETPTQIKEEPGLIERTGDADAKKEEPAPEPISTEPPKPHLVRWKEAVKNLSWGGMEQESECGRYLLQYSGRPESNIITMRYPGGQHKSPPAPEWNREAFQLYTNFTTYAEAVEEAERYEAERRAKEAVQEAKKPLIEWYGTESQETVWLDNLPRNSYKYRIHSLPPTSSQLPEGPDKNILLYWNMRGGSFQERKYFATVQEAKDHAESLERAATAPQEKKPLVEWERPLENRVNFSVLSKCGRFQIFIANTGENGTYFYHKRQRAGHFANYFSVKDLAEAVKKAEELAPTEPPYPPQS